MEYSQRSRSNAVSFSEIQRSLYMGDDSYDKDLYQFERDIMNHSYPSHNSNYCNQFKKTSQQSLATDENGFSSYNCLNEGSENEYNLNIHSKSCLDNSRQVSIDNLRSAEDLKVISEIFMKNLNIQEPKLGGNNDSNIPTAKLIQN
ncbi:hypothetical protein ABPG72_011626 [Tetrahymena utriculariae]